MIPSRPIRRLPLVLSLVTSAITTAMASAAETGDFAERLAPFFEAHCYECHDGDVAKGDLDLDALSRDLSDPATFARWERLFDRVIEGEMPPKNRARPGEGEREGFRRTLAPALVGAHEARKGTVLRRLNRIEYENTLADLLGIRIDAASRLTEDGRSGEFDTVGEALGISASQMQAYLALATEAIDLAIAKHASPPEPATISTTYAETREGEQHIGKAWHRADDGAVVFFRETGYPTGMLRTASAKQAGLHRIRVTGYAYQSGRPVIFSVGGTSFQPGSERPIYGYYAFSPGRPGTVELTAWMDRGYMLEITPQGLHDPENLIRQDGVAAYPGPGLAILSVELTGPLVEEFPGRGHRLVFEGLERREIEPRNPAEKSRPHYRPRFEVVVEDPPSAAGNVLRRFAEAAFRRPVAIDEVGPYRLLFEREFAEGGDFEESLRVALAAVLCSPDFLYLREAPGALDDHALAARLSYFLHRSLPDRELLADATGGRFARDPAALRRHALRMLADGRSDRFVADFTDGWLDLRSIEFTNPDEQLFPEFDRYLQDSMVAETRAYFRELLRENLDSSHLAKSDFAMLNWRLARHYGIEGVDSPTVARTALPPGSVRGGLLSQASVLKVSANGTNTSPVLRGVWINERIFGKHPAPPPPGIPGVEPDIRGATTLRELLDRHRSSESCQACHEMIDPPGFALESFDPIGGWREHFRSLGEGEKPEQRFAGSRGIRYRIGPPVDASGRLVDGRDFAGFAEFRDLVAEDREGLARAFLAKLLTFATGREMGFSDRDEIDALVRRAGETGYGIRDLVLLAVSSEIFLRK